jgi:competence ComEA-like helix-hairpin-helix protein
MNLEENLRIDINAASAEELCRLPGIDLALAQRIVAYRQERGPFQAEEELRAVEGVGPSLYAGLEAYVVVQESGTEEAAAAVPTEGKLLEKIRFQAERTRTWLAHSPFFRTRRRAVVSALVILPIFLCLGYWLLGSIAFAHTATLTDLKGVVQTRREQATAWEPAHKNQMIKNQDRVRTGEMSAATLLFFDVSTADLDEQTEVSVVEVSTRRGGSVATVILKTWAGKTWVRAVRFADPASTFRVDTPTASTVVRGARLNVAVAADGSTQVDVEQGWADVTAGGETMTVGMGEQAVVTSGADLTTRRVFEPDARPVEEKVQAAFESPEKEFYLELEELEINQYLMAILVEGEQFFTDPQVWFVEDEIVLGARVTAPIEMEVTMVVVPHIKQGQIHPVIESISAGGLPVPSQLANTLVDFVMENFQAAIGEAYKYLDFSDIRIEDGKITIKALKTYE